MNEVIDAAPAAALAPEPSSAPGRSCPLHYRYGAEAIARLPARPAESLYVVGGLYGNVPALDEVERMVAAESAQGVKPVLCFNGDFNWFDIADDRFAEINRRVLAHDAIVGNVEAEFGSEGDDAGCGCAYPDSVDSGVVERSNAIHAELKATARRHPALAARIAALPMIARYEMGGQHIGVVHGDADSLAGWRFDVDALDDAGSRPWLRATFDRADVDVFASTHTCLPALRAFVRTTTGVDVGEGGRTREARTGWIANNGATGMPNFSGDTAGLCTRIALTPSPHPAIHEVRAGALWLSILPVRFDVERWQREFLAQWPAGSAAWTSYWARICHGPRFSPDRMIAPGN